MRQIIKWAISPIHRLPTSFANRPVYPALRLIVTVGLMLMLAFGATGNTASSTAQAESHSRIFIDPPVINFDSVGDTQTVTIGGENFAQDGSAFRVNLVPPPGVSVSNASCAGDFSSATLEELVAAAFGETAGCFFNAGSDVSPNGELLCRPDPESGPPRCHTAGAG